MKEYRNEAHEFFSNLSDEEFSGFLEESGFELEEGEGKVILADEEENTNLDELIELLSGSYYSQKEVKTENIILENVKVKKSYADVTFKNMNNDFKFEGYGVA